MRRALVLSDETARHRFLASLPPQVRFAAEPAAVLLRHRIYQDLRDFLAAYCACFIAVSLYIA